MGELGASCFNTLNDNTRDIDKPEWDEQRFGMICGTAEVFADSKRTILQLCKAYKKCRYDDKSKIMTYTDKENKKQIVFLFKRVNDFNVEIKNLKGE